MKFFFRFLYVFFLYFLFLTFIQIKSTTYDGTSNIVYKTSNIVTHGVDIANGKVLFKGGLTVLGNASARLNISSPIFTSIDLRVTGTLDLQNDLVLDSLTTVSPRGGTIRGGGHTIFLTGDLSLPTSTLLTFTGNTIIDGQGHDLIIGKYAQLLLEGGISVTFRNMTIRDVLSTANIPQIRCEDWYSSVCFDNVVFDLNDDFVFRNGQFFIHNDVEFTGTSKFSYRSVRPSYVEQHANLIFSPNSTFEYYPSSTTKSLIKMMDKTSAIIFDGSTLQSTHTGVRFTAGSIYFDNKVTFSSADNTAFAAFMDLGVGSSAYVGASSLAVDWSPNGQYLAAAQYTAGGNSLVKVFQWSNEVLVTKSSTLINDVWRVKWSPDGRYLAVGSNGSPNVNIFLWDGTQLINKVRITAGGSSHAYSIAWHPSGKYLAVGGDAANVYIYRWYGSSAALIGSGTSLGGDVDDISWDPSGNYLAAVGVSALKMFSWNGLALTLKTTYSFSPNYGYSVSWSPDGLFLVVSVVQTPNSVQIFGWNGSSLNLITTYNLSTFALGAAWAPSGKFIAIGGSNTGNQNVLLFEWYGSSISLKAYKVFPAIACYRVTWSPDGKYLAVVGLNNNPDLIVYRMDKKFDTSPQGFVNGIIFGNSTIGSSQDLDVNLMKDANIQIYGQFWYDDVS